MVGTFGSLNTALSGLRYSSVVLQNSSNNVSNASTDGYVRRRVVGAEVGGPDRPVMYSFNDSVGDGVKVDSLQRMVDPLLDARVRREHAAQSYLDTQYGVLSRVEAGIGEPSSEGVAQALSDFKQAWQDLANNPGVPAPRQQVIARAQILSDALAAQSKNISGEEADQRVKLDNLLTQVNDAAAELASLNKNIYATSVNKIDNASLLDARDKLALRLSELVGATVQVQPNGMFDVTVNGATLVSGDSASALSRTSADGALPLTFAVGGTPLDATGMQGELGATKDLLTTTLPAYRAGLNEIARQFADAVNAQHTAGYDSAGVPGGDFFDYVAGDEAATLSVLVTDPDEVAASSVAAPSTDGGNADAMVDVGTAQGDYQRLVNGFGTTVASLGRQAANQAAMTAQVDNSWESQAGVNLDEETITMVTAQRSYEASAKLLSVLDSMLDTLINRMAVR